MTFRNARFAGLAAVAALSLAASFAPHPARAQVQWGYSFVNNVALASYLGDVTVPNGTTTLKNVTITGTCTGCGGGGGVDPTVPNTWTATQTFNGSSSTLAAIFKNIGEPVNVVAGAPGATTNFDILTQSVAYYTSNAANNWTLNIRGNGSTALNSAMLTNQALTLSVVTTQGGTAFYNNAVTIDGVSVTPKWQGGVPTGGNINGLDVYTYTVIKTGSATYTVLATQVPFL